MKLKIKFVGFDLKEVEVDANGQKYSDILESLGINPETVESNVGDIKTQAVVEA